MRMSCNGCRVLRKGCSDDCSIRPCLEWIKNPDSQAKATVFLAKFYGRAGLMNLINSGPSHLRPAVFRSLLYEACGRIVNPIYGSVGLLWTGNWQLCQNAVEAVLVGTPITQISTEGAENKNGPPLKAFDIRHVNKEDNFSGSGDLHRVRTRCRFKRSGGKAKRSARFCVGSDESGHDEVHRSPSHESSLSHQSAAVERICPEMQSEADPGVGSDPSQDSGREDEVRVDDGEMELELTLGFEPFRRSEKAKEVVIIKGSVGSSDEESGLCQMGLRLDYPDL